MERTIYREFKMTPAAWAIAGVLVAIILAAAWSVLKSNITATSSPA